MTQLGLLVRSQSNNLGVGKVLSLSDTEVKVEYFCSVGQRIEQSLPLNSVGKVKLPRQTRCYIWNKSQETWIIGRVYEWDEEHSLYQVDLPDSKTILVGEADVYVRCNIPIADPIEILTMKGHETPYFHDKRLNFVKSCQTQRAVTDGMTGLISANIKLYPHQVEVVRRVLSDPIQRYLLADEVGLGKTIEAGAILRQYLLDEPSGPAVVLVPQYLLEQWQTELENKFYISHFGDRVKIYSIEDANQVSRHAGLGLLIIDEAHHVAAMATSTESVQRRYFDTCKQLAHKSDRLLLLSATPVLNNEQGFLTMLHLLDPDTYRLDDLEGFRDRVQKRSSIGKVLLSFRGGAEPSILKTNLNQLRNLFAEDKYVLEKAEELENSLLGQPETKDKIIQTIRTHITDTYRLHRRMLRNYRTTVEDVIYDRNVTPKVEYDLDERSFDIHEVLDNWRTSAPKDAEFTQIFLLFFRAAGTWLGVLKAVITARLNGKSTPALTQEFGAEDVNILTRTELFAQEAEILLLLLKIIEQPSEDGDRIELLRIVLLYHFAERFGLQSYRSNPSKLLERVQQRLTRPIPGDNLPKILIFTSFGQSCAEIFKELQKSFGEKAIAAHQLGKTRAQVEKSLQQFKTDPNCFILVCDPSGEEGRNLQFADWMIHFDLPWSPNRLEQRIGRCDRIGRPLSMEFTVFAGVELDDSFHDAWYQLLKDGFRIFKQSISSLQFYAEEKLPQLATTLFESGAKGLLEAIPAIQGEITQEQVKISEQNALDEIDAQDESATKYFQALDECDAKHQDIQRGIEGWICQALHLQQRQDINLQGVLRYEPTGRTLVPADHLKAQFVPYLKQSGTYNRSVANQNPGVRLYRIGEGLVESLSSYIRWDDRGQAFAMWRTDETWDASEGMEWFGFRFNYIVESNLEFAKQVFAEYGLDNSQYKILRRRTDALFPSIIKTVFIDARSQLMSIVDSEPLLNILQRTYNGKKGRNNNRDYNLAKSRLVILDRFIDGSQWQETCRKARSTSETLLRDRPDFIEICQQSATRAENKLENRINQLRLRLGKLDDPVLAKELNIESALSQAILEGIRHPNIRLDSVGFIVVSGQPPAQIGEDGDD